MQHIANATNWNGDRVSVTFTMAAKDFDKLCRKAHDAFHRDGLWTIRLDSVDDKEVDARLRYQ